MKINTTYLHDTLHYCNHSKNFHPKASELLLVTQILIYNQLEYIQNPISNTTLEHNNSDTTTTTMDTIQRQSIDQNLRKLAETSEFADIYTQDYSGYFKDIKDYRYLNGEKYRQQDISPINIFSFVTLKNEILAFLGWP